MLKRKRLIAVTVFLLTELLLYGCGGGQADVSSPRNPKERIVSSGGAAIEKVTDLNVGDTVTFGTYEQDNDTSNGAEPIEWTVMDVEEDRAYLLSRYVLDAAPYNVRQRSVTWKSCTLRRWLNTDFYETAFSDEDRGLIAATRLKNKGYTLSFIPGGCDTTDKVFIPDLTEIGRYYGYNELTITLTDDGLDTTGGKDAFRPELAAAATPYANTKDEMSSRSSVIDEGDYERILKDRGYDSDIIGTEGTDWWLRTPGSFSVFRRKSAYVSSPCLILERGPDVEKVLGIRPALYVSW